MGYEEEAGGRSVDIETLAMAIAAALRVSEAKEDPSVPAFVATLPRYYESTVFDLPGTGAGFHAIFVATPPELVASHQFGGPPALATPDVIHPYLPVEPDLMIGALLAARPDRTPWFTGTSLESRVAPPEPDQWTGAHLRALVTRTEDSEGGELLIRFAARALMQPVVPVEASPLHGASLAQLLGKAGAVAGLAVSDYTHDPFLFVTTAIGYVLWGGVMGMHEGLHRGLSDWIAAWFGARMPQAPPEDAED